MKRKKTALYGIRRTTSEPLLRGVWINASYDPREALRYGLNKILRDAGLPTLDDDEQPLEPMDA